MPLPAYTIAFTVALIAGPHHTAHGHHFLQDFSNAGLHVTDCTATLPHAEDFPLYTRLYWIIDPNRRTPATVDVFITPPEEVMNLKPTPALHMPKKVYMVCNYNFDTRPGR